MKTIYLAHCYSDPDPTKAEANRKTAAEWACWIHSTFQVAVSCSWIVMTGGIAETAEARALGMAANAELVERADEIWLVGERLSDGMLREREHALENKVAAMFFVGLTRTQIEADLIGLRWDPR